MQVIHPDLLGDSGDQNLAAEITEFSEIACTLESRGGGLLLRKNPLGISGIGLTTVCENAIASASADQPIIAPAARSERARRRAGRTAIPALSSISS